MRKERDYPDAVIANNLKRLFKERNVTYHFVAEAIGKERKSVCAWANGNSNITANDLKRICDLFRVSADEIMGIKYRKRIWDEENKSN